MKRYKVLWLEDELKKVEAFLDRCYQNGIDIKPVPTLMHFKEELSINNMLTYDAIILDAKGVLESTDEAKSLKAVSLALNHVISIGSDKEIPYFILSGQLGSDENRSALEMLAVDRVYIKSRDEEKLISDLIVAADDKINTKVRQQYNGVLNYLAQKDCPSSLIESLFKLLRHIKLGEDIPDDQLYFTEMRKILEHQFRVANKLGLLHDKCLNDRQSVNLTEAGLFLSGKDTKYLKVKCSKTHFPYIIADSVKTILHTTGAAAHTSEIDVSRDHNIQEYRNLIKTPYLLYSLVYRLLDVIIWFDTFEKTNSDVELNKSFWVDLALNSDDNSQTLANWIRCEVIRIADNGFGTAQYASSEQQSIIPSIVNQHSLAVGDSIEIVTEVVSGNKIHIKELRRK